MTYKFRINLVPPMVSSLVILLFFYIATASVSRLYMDIPLLATGAVVIIISAVVASLIAALIFKKELHAVIASPLIGFTLLMAINVVI